MVIAAIYNFIKAEGNLRETKILIKKPEITYSIIVAYVLLVKWLIPWIMKNRKAFDLRGIVIAYNLMLCLLNATVALYLISYLAEMWQYRCEVQTGPSSLWHLYTPRGINLVWYAWLLKYVELLDTILFALRKKDKNITFLHLFHHTLVIILFLGGYTEMRVVFYYAFAVALNLAVHVIMYLYYGLAAIGPKMQKYLWWKKYLTLVQIGQFIIMLLYGIIAFLTGCEEVSILEALFFVFVAIVLFLFINFYVKSYRQRKLQIKSDK